MAKDAYYFTHDANASNDPKMLKMRSMYGWEGYGWYWALIEMMRQEEDYSLDLDFMDAFAMHLQCDGNALNSFINDCVKIGLFIKNNGVFFSDSLRRRMSYFDEKREKARQSAKARWGDKQSKDANAMRTQCERNASKVNKSKVNKSKVEESIPYREIIDLFNQSCPSLPKVKDITSKRKTAIKVIHNKSPDIFSELFSKVEASDFLTGRTERKGEHKNWKCTLDWILEERNRVRILEGVFDNQKGGNHGKYSTDYNGEDF